MPSQRAHDRTISDLARRQHGVVARWQLFAAGVPKHIVDDRVNARSLVLLRRGIYAPGHAQLRPEGEWLAAVLSCGPDAVLGHRTAAVLWDLEDGSDWPIHVVTGTRHGRVRRRGVLPHAVILPPSERTVRRAIPATTLVRTILDVAPSQHERALEQVVRRAVRRHRMDLGPLRVVVDNHPRHRGAAPLRRLLTALETRKPADLRSRMEIAMAALCDDFGLPRPECNEKVLGERVDFWWPGSTLVVETDGFEFHAMPTTFADDRRRDQKLTLGGYTVLRLTYEQVTREREATAALISTMLARLCAR